MEPSYVIQRFLDVGGAGRIDNLVKYLQRLHERKEANSDHTTLLLNCYTQSRYTSTRHHNLISRDVLRCCL